MFDNTDSEQNVASTAAKKWHSLVAAKFSDEQIVDLWNEHVQAEANETLRQTTETGRSRTVANFKKWRRTFWNENEARLEKVVERTEVGTLRLKRPVQAKPPQPPTLTLPEGMKLSATEQAILLSTRKPIEAVESVLVRLDDSEATEIRRAAEEAEATERRLQDFVLWACEKADAEVDLLKTRTGEALWSNAVTVETFEPYPLLRIVFVRSSTAPMLGAHGPIVKHDFRANGKPVNTHHESMFRQLDGQRLIRSRVIAGKAHEYYVKALQYQEGMYFKGYFVVEGEERGNGRWGTDLARYYVLRDGKVVSITEAEYRRLENQAAARRR
jgi:hypothetical protein